MKTILLLIGLSISLGAHAQRKFFNDNYKLQRQEVRIALIPFLTSDKLYTLTIKETLLQDNLAKVRLGDLKIIGHNILTDTSLNESVRMLIEKEYLNQELKHNPNLSKFISASAMTNMKNMLDSSDILLIPSKIKSRKVKNLNGTGSTTVSGRFRLYDLGTGEFIFDYVAKNEVQYLIADNEIRELMAVVLEDFHSYYFKNFIARNNLTDN